jgi:SAM-dependent methyltransferase
MNALDNWKDSLSCVRCHGKLRTEEEALVCVSCRARYDRSGDGVPIMMTPEDLLRFGIVLDRESGATMEEKYIRRYGQEVATRLWRALSPPEPVYVDPEAPPLPRADSGLNLWLGGGGLDTGNFINIDLSPFYGVEIVAHAGRLPFLEDSCDRVACLALLEHVPDPSEIVKEILRVLKPGSKVEAVVPFCHPYHAYPSDYMRFSREGLTDMFADFDSLDVGIRTGPTTTMLTFLTYYGKLIFPVHTPNTLRRWFNRGVMGLFGWVAAPFSYLDRWINRLPDAHVLANHFYVTAYKPNGKGSRHEETKGTK